MTEDTNLAYYNLSTRKYISWEFYSQYLDKEPPFGELGALVFIRTYSRFIEELGRREYWRECCLRVVEYSLSLDSISSIKDKSIEAEQLFDMMFNLRGFPAGRTLWIGGTKITETNGTANFNCSAATTDSLSKFAECFYMLMVGAGYGFSVAEKYIENLPVFYPGKELINKEYEYNKYIKVEDTEVEYYNENKFLKSVSYSESNLYIHSDEEYVSCDNSCNKVNIIVGDSRVGWVNTLRLVLTLLTHPKIKSIVIDYDYVRPEGTPLKTFGGRASGYVALQNLLERVLDTINELKSPSKISSVQCLDILNSIGIAVIVGGVRRSSQLALGDLKDIDFITAKKDLWNDESLKDKRITRVMSNNSVTLYENPGLEYFQQLMESVKTSGEPGIYSIGNAQKRDLSRKLTNPCGEILLDDRGVCNLTEANVVAHIKSDNTFDWEIWNQTIVLITRMGSRITLVSMWHPEWNKTQKRDRLLGVSMTGIIEAFDMLNWSQEQIETFYQLTQDIVEKQANIYHDYLGIERSLLKSTIKPSGCRPWNGLTTTDKGILTLEELLENHPTNNIWNSIEGYNAINTNESNKITKTYVNGKAEVFNINLAFGHELESTGNHKWYVKERRVRMPSGRSLKITPVESWVETKDLVEGDIIETLTNNYINNEETNLLNVDSISFQMREDAFIINQPTQMSPDIAWLLGYLWGDGCMSPSGFRLRFIDEHLFNLNKVQQILKTEFNLDTIINKCKDRKAYTLEIGSKLLWHWLIKNNIWKYYNDKLDIIPKVIRTSSKESIIAFIAGLIDSDGCVSGRNQRSKHCVYLSTTYDLFAQHLQEVALTVGISFGKSLNTKGENKQKVKHIWSMAITQYTSADSFSILSRHSNKIMNACLNENPIWVFQTTTRSLKKLGEVQKITSIGEKNTYDIEVENSHYYYAGSFKSHNSLSQLPTVSSGIHRPYAPFYLRRIRVSKQDPLALALYDAGLIPVPENSQGEDLFAPNCNTWVFTFPVKTAAPILSIDESAIVQLERYKTIMKYYVQHNCSITVSVAEHEWGEVAEWLYKNYEYVIGISFLPRFNPVDDITGKVLYPNLPYQTSTEKEYNYYKSKVPVLTESQLIKLLQAYEKSYEETDLGSDCVAFCPIR